MAAMTSAQRRAQRHAKGRSSTHAASSHVIGGDPCTACYFGAVQAEPLTLGAPLEVGVEPYVKGSAAGGLSAGSRFVPRAQPVCRGAQPRFGSAPKKTRLLSPALGHHPAQEATSEGCEGKATELQLQQLTSNYQNNAA